MWAEYVNSRGGICGRQVQLFVVDDHTDPAQHVAALRDLVENRHVVAFVANGSSATGAAGIEYIESTDVPVIGSVCTTPETYSSPSFYLACPDFSAAVFGIARTGAVYGPKSHAWGLLYCREATACSDARRQLVDNGGAKAAGLEVKYSGPMSIAQPDYTSECRAAQSAGADILSVFADNASFQRVIQSCSRQGYNPVYLLSLSTVEDDTKDIPDLRVIAAGSSFSFVGTETPARQEFQDVMATYYGSPPGPQMAGAWAGARLFELAATRAAGRSGSITPRTLTDALHTMENETLGGLAVPLTFPAGSPGRYPPCWFAMTLENGEFHAASVEPVCRD